jgi:thioredoxin-related protein|tara:strand:+ start:316 stop:822 length:507 start_codon:yes stop_codon:yes gene_type:complete
MHSNKFITLIIFSIILFFVYYSINSAPNVSDEKYTYLGSLTWYNQYDDAVEVSLGEDKPMLIYFWAIWCKYCENLHTEVYPDFEVSKYLQENFTLLAIDLDEDQEFSKKFGVQFPPHLIFLSSKGDVITRIPGGISKEEFLFVLERIAKHKGYDIDLSSNNLAQTRER